MIPHRLVLRLSFLYFALSLLLPVHASSQAIPSPEEFFGFQMGADRKLAHWDQMLEYYDLIHERSDRVKVVDMGESTLGNRFLALFISSPENLANLDALAAAQGACSLVVGAVKHVGGTGGPARVMAVCESE